MVQVRSRAEIARSPELPVAHRGTSYREENSNPERKTKGFVLTEKFIFFLKMYFFLYFIPPSYYNKGRINLYSGENHGRSSIGTDSNLGTVCGTVAKGICGAKAEAGVHELGLCQCPESTLRSVLRGEKLCSQRRPDELIQ